ncbi:hypothetical protein [Actinoplanes sp. TFC3]|uniref:hypothetical protein n=1 Tax=Actinoplanes sp. TFC3 TaxID=1710355 RepID=UPI00082D4FE0|nr:hypothetical protein [Actinoplanes sp. TFC3]
MPFTEYFVADDDQAALAALGSSGPASVGLPTVEAKNLDPVVVIGTLESLLTGVPYDEVTADPRQGHAVSDPEASPEEHVIAITDRLRGALAAAGDAELGEVGARWGRTEELDGFDPEFLTAFLVDLAALARRDGQLYCWWAL